jgi:hypothetical protein
VITKLGNTIPSGGANNEDHGDGGEAMVIKCSAWKRRKRKTKSSRQR